MKSLMIGFLCLTTYFSKAQIVQQFQLKPTKEPQSLKGITFSNNQVINNLIMYVSQIKQAMSIINLPQDNMPCLLVNLDYYSNKIPTAALLNNDAVGIPTKK